ncbi:hypothetical protein RM52_04030 [Microbacterium hominis]|uniref:D-inositol 3-phosphate glycosyltransferase n=1 Tax=Microbacterium hominis TaxID=162426 RepID=A0A0B4D5B0_9MICO|nr:glycosyltransferase [Microbacterium hominis]KIC59375.1 hypothetical protein RM52_04030 [Microbacterium hominis]
MRIAHVLTYASADGAFGGPTRVALAQAKALAGLGHDVTVFAGAPADEATDRVQDGYRLRTFPARRVLPFGGFATLWPRGLARALKDQADQIDVAHIHLARDLSTLPAALTLAAHRVPYVVQAHGMVDTSQRPLARILDIVATKRVLRRAHSWLVLTDSEQSEMMKLAPGGRVTRITNGVEIGDVPPLGGSRGDVLFLARLHERKRPVAFVEIAKALGADLPHATFTLIGPDEGEGEAVKQAIAGSGMADRLRWLGPVPPSATSAAFTAARVYVLPAVNEVFPMSILESFAAGTPVVTTSSLGIAGDCRKYGAAVVTDGSVREMAQAVREVYVDDQLSESLRAGARTYLSEKLDVRSVANTLVGEYVEAQS